MIHFVALFQNWQSLTKYDRKYILNLIGMDVKCCFQIKLDNIRYLIVIN